MATLRLILAFLLPWATGFIWMGLFWRHSTPGALAGRLGYGYFAGALLTALIMVSFDGLGLPQHYWATLVALGVLAVWGHGLLRLLSGSRNANSATRPYPAIRWSVLNWRHAVLTLLLLLLAGRFANFFLEIIWRPLYPWDAFGSWGRSARIWFELGTLVPTYAKHPPLISLFQFWPALALGYWDESLINLPWFCCALALAISIYGQSRSLGASPLFALLLCYLMLSLPFLGVHILLAGYGDVWLGSFFALAIMAFIRWVWHRDDPQGVLAVGLAMLLPLTKFSGILWTVTFIPALLIWFVPRRWLGVALVVGGGGLFAWYVTTGIQFEVPGVGQIFISSEQLTIPGYFHGEKLRFYPVWDAFNQNLLQLANWHLVWYLIPLATLWAVVYAGRDRVVAVVLAPAFTGLLYLIFVYFFTWHSGEAADYTGLNRAFLHLTPALIVSLGAILIRYRKQALVG